MIACGFEGGNRYEREGAQFTRFTSAKVQILTQLRRGSGWTTWKKKDSLDGKKRKFNKDGSEKKPRTVQPKVQAVGHLAPPKQPGANVPRYVWLDGGGSGGGGVLYIRIYIHTCIHAYIHTYVYTSYIHAYMWMHIHIYM